MRWLRARFARFGIAAPRVTVKSHTPWHWRAGVLALIALASFGLGVWSVDDTQVKTEAEHLRGRVAALEEEAAKLRGPSGAEALLRIAQTAQQQLSEQVKTLETENSRLREENAVIEKLVATRAAQARKR